MYQLISLVIMRSTSVTLLRIANTQKNGYFRIKCFIFLKICCAISTLNPWNSNAFPSRWQYEWFGVGNTALETKTRGAPWTFDDLLQKDHNRRRRENNKTKLPLATAAIPGHQPTTIRRQLLGMNLLLPAFGVSDLHETEMSVYHSESGFVVGAHTLEISIFNKAKGKPIVVEVMV